ncbi:uncharacterized protein LOC132721042 isoform X1 [Ruditapes philippinarum]|uniref:uncharacterized protein LOC132721042 isoform X1 n=1 Tax=Ruditapes philippinarum TaxID=129788 RepID=UPI00295BFB8F|nr:uncharacterized protein LOC132721042 isoform X1 [Ruditapes philippinarum]
MAGHRNVTAIQPSTVHYPPSPQIHAQGFRTYPLGTHVPVPQELHVPTRTQHTNIPLQQAPYVRTSPGRYGAQQRSHFQPLQETSFGPSCPSVSQQVQIPASPKIADQPTTLGSGNYVPHLPPSGAPPSYEAAVNSSYNERMEEYKTDWDSRR